MSRNFQFAVDEFYHVYNRGTDKRIIFLDDNDRKRFYYLLFLCNGEKSFEISELDLKQVFDFKRGETLVDIGAVCLMDNHFHLLLHEKKENGISKFMHKISTAYTNYFNRKYKRTGALFGGRFKAEHSNNDRYLNYLFAYIHLNPIKVIQDDWQGGGINDLKKVQKYLEKYVFSSYLDYQDSQNRLYGLILNKEAFPEYFSEPKDFDVFINDWLELKAEKEEVEKLGE
ncbi:MAG: transposase [Candidatus Vogelbacteria bacterium]|nr:transposase [Candidatus Vogelbacteria bacterium]